MSKLKNSINDLIDIQQKKTARNFLLSDETTTTRLLIGNALGATAVIIASAILLGGASIPIILTSIGLSIFIQQALKHVIPMFRAWRMQYSDWLENNNTADTIKKISKNYNQELLNLRNTKIDELKALSNHALQSQFKSKFNKDNEELSLFYTHLKSNLHYLHPELNKTERSKQAKIEFLMAIAERGFHNQFLAKSENQLITPAFKGIDTLYLQPITGSQLYRNIDQALTQQYTKAQRRARLGSDMLKFFTIGGLFMSTSPSKGSRFLVGFGGLFLSILFIIFAAPILGLMALDKKRADKAASKKIRYDAVAKHDDGDNDAVQAQAPTLQAATSPQAQAPVSQPDSTPPAIPTTDKPTTFPRPPASPDAQQAGLHTQNNAAISSAQRAQYELTDTQQKVTSP